ncbi:hypothetical protein [Chelatococcus asaccharovorans]|nr:hypothetical protein [Chelatococcus asaccharovorans]MBS7704638.1 hypothetical protein [Chelatococcus asaccharovorans]
MRFKREMDASSHEDMRQKRQQFQERSRKWQSILLEIQARAAIDSSAKGQRLLRRTNLLATYEQRQRDERARGWRDARKRLMAFDAGQRSAIIDLWRDCPYPADPGYLSFLLGQIERGKIDPFAPPWRVRRR